MVGEREDSAGPLGATLGKPLRTEIGKEVLADPPAAALGKLPRVVKREERNRLASLEQLRRIMKTGGEGGLVQPTQVSLERDSDEVVGS